MKLKISFRGMSDPGKQRRNNEDSYLINESLSLAMVADGMGGHNAGEIASNIATEVTNTKLQLLIRDKVVPPLMRDKFCLKANQLAHAIELASLAIYDSSLAAGNNGMGTTATAAILENNRLYIAHVGDSRAYLIREGKLAQLTEDHSFVMESVKKGLMTLEQAETSPLRNMLTRALGNADLPDVDLIDLAAHSGDKILLCTDGLFKCETEKEMLDIVNNSQDDLDACDDLIELCNKNGGIDNITVVIGTISDEKPATNKQTINTEKTEKSNKKNKRAGK